MAIGNLAVSNLFFPINATTLPLSGITGAATTYTFTAATYALGGKVYAKATAAGAATPTSEATGLSLVLTSSGSGATLVGTGTVLVWTVNASGTVALYRGSLESLDAASAFLRAPEFPALPDTVVPFAYVVLKNNTGSNLTVGSSNWSAFTSAVTQNVMYMPERLQVA
jgi:hypothetical protein